MEFSVMPSGSLLLSYFYNDNETLRSVQSKCISVYRHVPAFLSSRLQRRQEATRVRSLSSRVCNLRDVDLHELRERLESQQEGPVRTGESFALRHIRVLRGRSLQAVSLDLRDLRRSDRRFLHILPGLALASEQKMRRSVRRGLLLGGAAFEADMHTVSSHVQDLRVEA